MDLEALLLGLEPAVALGVGIAALAVAPVIGALGNTEIGKNLSDSGRTLAKHGIKSGMETFEKIQETVAEVGESWNDIVAEAQQERKSARNSQKNPEPQNISISE
ncbi:conserved hypothetical protein [Gloeothece citriformis PCC 7424]|uniref:DUF5132 domain-containing protein n=1 Tax=Gloeothece citriformis (strain PCC 7424) TaxID=65393 RepID=B7KAL7_GLOC7|nr:DUF5132 domain-containing protein [Gloeothece citriformis]ACK68689.1 conserved hypothetical protein [Gloeothece citriformis PCC 7424]